MMAYPGMHENEAKETDDSADEEYMEKLGSCDSDMISECCGTSTVKDFKTVNVTYADNSAYNKTQIRGV